MRIPALLLLPYLAIAASCGGSSSSSTAVPENASSEATDAVAVALPSDDDIIAKLYDPHYSVPNDFFVDERAGTAQSYTVHHVMDASNSYELCTDDSTVAEAWEAADNASRSVSGYYVGAHETERYFEFIRELSYDDDVGNISDLTSPGFARVFKCSNTSRDGVDRSLLSGFAGTINARPLTAERVRDFAEYFWQFTFFPERYKKVLASYPAGDANGYGRTLLIAFASTQGTGLCDRVEIVEWRFVGNRDSGEIHRDFRRIRYFEAELANGAPRLCD